MERKHLLKKVKEAICEIEPQARVILFGSRARHEIVPDTSDWDFLILVNGSVDDKRKDRIRHRLYEIEWDTGEVLSAIIYNQTEWSMERHQTLPIHDNIDREGLTL